MNLQRLKEQLKRMELIGKCERALAKKHCKGYKGRLYRAYQNEFKFDK